MQVISFTVNSAEYEYPDEFDSSIIRDPVDFVRDNVVCPLTFYNFERSDLEIIFDGNWLSKIDPEEGVLPQKVEVHRASTSDGSINFDATFYFKVQLAGDNVNDEFIEENLSWATDMIDFLKISFGDDDFEEMSVGEKIGPNISS